MQSSTVITCRVLVMLAFLVVVPLVAILGSSPGAVTTALLEGRWAAAREPRSVAENQPAETTSDPVSKPRPAGPLSIASTSVVQTRDPRLAEVSPVEPPPLERVAPRVATTSYVEEFPRPDILDRGPLAAMTGRLDQLGATYHLPEPWGSQGLVHRFRCEVPIGGHADWTRHFEATDADPVEAMAMVLHEIEAWQAGQQ